MQPTICAQPILGFSGTTVAISLLALHAVPAPVLRNARFAEERDVIRRRANVTS
jgi:hypothetical protein